MSVMSRIRQTMGVIVVLVSLSLAAFILGDLFRGIEGLFGGPPKAGYVAGETVTYQDFAERYQTSLQNAQNNANNQGIEFTPKDRFDVMDYTWSQMTKEIVYKQEFDKLGLEVSGEEVYDLFAGRNISDIVRQNFEPIIRQNGGTFNANEMAAMLDQYIKDPQAKSSLKDFEEYIAQDRAEKKYKFMVKSGYVGSKNYANQLYQNQTKNVDLAFVAINYSTIADSLVDVSDSDLKSYLSKNKKKYKQNDAVFLDYVTFDVTPSAADSAKALNKLITLRDDFASTKNDSLFTASKSRIPFVDSLYNPLSRYSPQVRASIRSASIGEVVGPFTEGSYYTLYKVVGKESGEETHANVSHILIRVERWRYNYCEEQSF